MVQIDTYQYDISTVMSDGAAAYTANGTAQVGGAAKFIDLGGVPNRTDLGVVGTLAKMKGAVIIDVSAIDTTSTDETYFIAVMGSNLANGTLPVVLGGIMLGAGAALPNGSGAGTAQAGTGSTSTPGRFVVLVDNTQGLVTYRFLYLRNLIAGTTPSIAYRVWLSQQVQIG